MENEINFIEFVVEDNVANSKPEKIIKRVGMENQFVYEEFLRFCRWENGFYECAKKMEFFKDNSNIRKYEPFMAYSPRYSDMDIYKMKSYFVWRTKMRDGFVEQISTSYIFVYIYELLHLIGVNNAEEGFSKLMFLWENEVSLGFGPIHRNISFEENTLTYYLQHWMVDFVEYYNLPLNCLEHPILKTLEMSRKDDTNELVKAMSMKNYSVISDLIAKNGYNYKRGAFSKNAGRATLEKLAIKLFQNIMENNDFISKNLITERDELYFVSAVFEPKGHAKYLEEKKITRHLNKVYINELSRAIEIALDKIFGIPQRLYNIRFYQLMQRDVALIEKEMSKIAIENKIILAPKTNPQNKKIAFDYFRLRPEKNEVTQTSRVVEINVSSLSEIRDKADLIAEKLIPQDLLNEYKEEPKLEIIINYDVYTDDKEKEKDEWTIFINRLDDHGKKILSLIAGRSSYKDISGYAVGNYLMLEEEIEKINNLAIETIGDTIIKGNEKELLIYEEYLTNIEQILN